MIDPKPEAEGRGLAGEAAAATSDVAGEVLGAPVHQVLAGERAPGRVRPDKRRRSQVLDALHALGYNRFDQLAKLTPAELERIDAQLGPFKGRLQRDRVIEQADYLARGDTDGFESRFGKL